MATKSVRVVLEALVSQYQAKMAQATASTTAFGQSAMAAAATHNAAFTGMGLVALAASGALIFAMKGAADAATEFESSFAGVRKTVDATEPEFTAMAQALRDLAKEIPVNVNELNRIAEAAGQLGVEKDAILGFTETVAKLGVTTNLVGEEAATAFARIANVMQTPQDQFDRMGATVVALGNAGASTEAEIVEMAMRIAGAGKIVGLTEAEVLGFANALSSVGIEAQLGGTAISRVFIEIADSVATGGDQLEDFATVAGMSAAGFKAAFEQDAAGAMISFIEGLGRMDAAGENVFAVLEQLGLSETRVRDAMLRAAGAGDLFRESIELGSVAWEENSALNEEAAKRFDTTASKIQLASNRINDMAISFGQIMLPAIASVMGAIGDFANLVGGLPGPVRTLALVLGAVAAAMLLLAGGTLLLMPRLAAVKVLMADAGIQGGIMSASLRRAAQAVNPLTIGLTAATIALGVYASEKARARAVTEAFTAAIDADTGALGENTRATLINELQAAGLLKTLQEMGVSTDEVVDNILAMAEGNKEAAAATVALVDSLGEGDLAGVKLAGTIRGLEDGMAGYALKTEAAGEAAVGTGESTAAMGGEVDAVTGELTEAATATELFSDALDILAGNQLDVEKASLDWLDSLAALREELNAGTTTLDINSEAGRENRRAILDSIDAAIAHGTAVAEETGSLEAGERAVRSHIAALIEEAEKAGFSANEIREYIKQLNLTPKQIRTLIIADTAQAQSAVDQFITRNTGRTIHINVVTGETGPGPVDHAGGLVGASGATRFHKGGQLRGNERKNHRGARRAHPLEEPEPPLRGEHVSRRGSGWRHNGHQQQRHAQRRRHRARAQPA